MIKKNYPVQAVAQIALVTWGMSLGVGVSSGLGSFPPVLAQSSEPETSPPPQTEAPRFICQFVNSQYTVMYFPESQPQQSYPWAVPTQLGGGWTPERRCVEISRRLEAYRPDGLLELQTGRENNYDVVCVTTQQNPSCRIVFTVPPGQDPVLTRDRVFQNLILADGGNSADPVNTLTQPNSGSGVLGDLEQIFDLGLSGLGNGGRSTSPFSRGIDLRPFLDRRDGGTGTQLRATPSPVLP